MQVLPGLLTLLLIGDGAFRWIRRAGWIDPGAGPGAGIRLLLSTASVPWIVLAFDLTGIPITRASMGIAAVIMAGSGMAADRLRRGRSRADRRDGHPGEPAGAASAVVRAVTAAPPASVLVAATAALLLFSIVQFSIVPERNYDALVGYDLVGRIMAQEGVYRSTVFTKINYNAQCVYPPHTAANNGFWYLYHPEGWKLWVPVSAAGFLMVYFSLIRRWTGSRTAGALASFVLFLPTALLFQLTEAQTDMPSMVFTALALMMTVDSLVRGRAFPPGRSAWIALLLLFATVGRSENVLFGLGLAAAVLILMRAGRRGVWLFVLVPSAFFAFWNLLYVPHLLGYDPSAHFLDRLVLDPGRMGEVARLAGAIVADAGAFGELAWVIMALPVLWYAGSLPRIRERLGMDKAPDLTGMLLALSAWLFLVYLPFFYMWDPELNPLWTMEHTFKRGFFRFIPGLLAAVVCSPPVLWVLRRCESAAVPEGAGTGRGSA